MTNPQASPPLRVPAADAVQPDQPCQWWYWSGNLRAASGRRFGFQLAFFAAEAVRGLLWGQMVHFALVDVEAQRFVARSRVWLGAPRRIVDRFALASPGGEAQAWGGGGEDRLVLRGEGSCLDLRASGGPLALHYEGRSHAYAFGGSSYYYSRTAMQARARLHLDGRDEALQGEVWFDRQFGELMPALCEGWQWCSLHLESGEQLMVFGFERTPDERFAAHTDRQGRTRWLRGDAIGLEVVETWRSDATGIAYPAAWRLTTPDHALLVRACPAAQEMAGRRWWGPVYWEGACEVSGSARGQGYVELLGAAAPALARLRARVPALVEHPALGLGLATVVGRASARLASLRPRFDGPAWSGLVHERPAARHRAA